VTMWQWQCGSDNVAVAVSTVAVYNTNHGIQISKNLKKISKKSHKNHKKKKKTPPKFHQNSTKRPLSPSIAHQIGPFLSPQPQPLPLPISQLIITHSAPLHPPPPAAQRPTHSRRPARQTAGKRAASLRNGGNLVSKIDDYEHFSLMKGGHTTCIDNRFIIKIIFDI
jgi:hypothetical protein